MVVVQGQTEQWNRSLKSKPLYILSTDVLQGCLDHSIRETQSIQQTVLGKLNIHMEKKNAGPFLALYTRTNSKWIKDQNL